MCRYFRYIGILPISRQSKSGHYKLQWRQPAKSEIIWLAVTIPILTVPILNVPIFECQYFDYKQFININKHFSRTTIKAIVALTKLQLAKTYFGTTIRVTKRACEWNGTGRIFALRWTPFLWVPLSAPFLLLVTFRSRSNHIFNPLTATLPLTKFSTRFTVFPTPLIRSAHKS